MKTWIISKERKYLDYLSLELSEDIYFHYSKDLIFEYGNSRTNHVFLIIGDITDCSDVQLPVFEVLQNNTVEDFLRIKKFWGGRWAVYFEGILYTDFTSLYSVFWNVDKSLISNTFEVFKVFNLKQIDYNITNEYYLNWFVTPKTPFENVNKILPGTALKIDSGEFSVHKIDYVKIYSFSQNEVSELLSKSFNREADFILKKYDRTYVALSAGYDSRLIYSIFQKIAPEVKSFTHIFSSMNKADSTIPNRINKSNLKVYPKKLDKAKIKAYDQRSNKMVSDADRGFYGNGQWNFIKKNEAVVRGGVLELAGLSRAHLEDRIENFGESKDDSKLFLYALKDFRNFQHDSFRVYMDFYLHRNSSIRWSKQLYIDQRISAWLSYIELGLDLIEGTSLHLGNSEYVINLMLSQSPKNMKVKAFHLDEIKSNNEKLLNIPFNNDSTSDKIKRILVLKLSKFLGNRLTSKIFY